MKHAKSLKNGWSTVGDTGLDSYGDSEQERIAKFSLVSAALDDQVENGESQQSRNAVKAHLARLKESVKGALD